ncbi:hypothetical protein [Stenotrophomonas maltophilia]|uniref:hypothetical protein n=1 Tax=Stenotrophomonas maltophilia TaxID=40324 RepID=UPI0031B9E854
MILNLHQHPIHPTLAAPARCRTSARVPTGASVANLLQRLCAYTLDVAGELVSTSLLTSQSACIIDIEKPRYVTLAPIATPLGSESMITRSVKEAAN